jgi:hypothetical protein
MATTFWAWLVSALVVVLLAVSHAGYLLGSPFRRCGPEQLSSDRCGTPSRRSACGCSGRA